MAFNIPLHTVLALAGSSRQYLQAVQTIIDLNPSEIQHNPALQAALAAIDMQVQAVENPQPISAENFHQVVDACQVQIQHIRAIFHDRLPVGQIENIDRQANELAQNLEVCDRIYRDLLHQTNQPIENIIHDSSVQEAVCLLVRLNHEDGKESLTRLLQNNNPWAQSTFHAFLANPGIYVACNDIIRKLSARGAVEALATCLTTEKSTVFTNRCLEICRQNVADFQPLIAVLSTAIERHPWAYCALRDNYLQHHDIHIIQELCTLAIPAERIHLQNILIVIATDCPADDPLHPGHAGQFLQAQMNLFQRAAVQFPLNRIEQAQRIESLNRITFQKSGQPLPLALSQFSVEDRLATKILQIRREQHLIQFLLSGVDVAHPTYRPCSTFLPVARQVLIGNNEGYLYFQPQLGKALKTAEVELLTFSSQDHPVLETPNVRLCAVNDSPSLWMQDVCFAARLAADGQPVMVIPRLMESVDTLDSNAIILKRQQRILAHGYPADTPIFNQTLGNRVGTGQQIFIINSARVLDPELDNTHFAFTYNEGGNELIGTFWPNNPQNAPVGEPYMLLGEDTYDLNLRLIQRECRQIGLTCQNGAWELVAPSDTLDVNISPRDMRALFAKDRGLSSPNYVFPHEQVDYHSDTAMCIGRNGRIIINDSLAAWNAQQVVSLKERRRALKGRSSPSLTTAVEAEYDAYRTDARAFVVSEEIAERQLRQYGFTVRRVAGRFKHTDQYAPAGHRLDFTNFFNCLTLQTPQSISKKLFIMLGCSEEYQVKCKRFIHHEMGILDAQIIFLDQATSELLLRGEGGIRCIIKRCSVPF